MGDFPPLKQPGDSFSADDYNRIVRLLRRNVTGPNVISTPAGWHVREKKRPGMSGPTGGASIDWGNVVMYLGTTPPFLYKLKLVTPNGDGTFSDPSGSDFDGYNVLELPQFGVGFAPVEVGTNVPLFNGNLFAIPSYRGTYL